MHIFPNYVLKSFGCFSTPINIFANNLKLIYKLIWSLAFFQ